MKKYIKDHKIVLVATIFLLIFIVISYILKTMLFSNGGDATYGSRLNGIENVKVTKANKESLIKKLEDDSSVNKCECIIHGKIINAIITVNDDTSLDTAKSLASKVLEEFDDDQKSFYDFQVFITKNNESSNFPIIGYKQNHKEGFSWSKDR